MNSQTAHDILEDSLTALNSLKQQWTAQNISFQDCSNLFYIIQESSKAFLNSLDWRGLNCIEQHYTAYENYEQSSTALNSF